MTRSQARTIFVETTDLIAAISEGSTRLRNASVGQWTTAIPTCPGWTMRNLVGHIGEVQRWAAFIVVNQLTENPPDDAVTIPEMPDGDAALDWFEEGATTLVSVLRSSPVDLECFTFLP